MGLLLHVVVDVVVVGLAALWLRREVSRQVSRLMTHGCPMFDSVPAQMKDIERRLEATEQKAEAAVSTALCARQEAGTAAERKARDERLETAPARTQVAFGRRL